MHELAIAQSIVSSVELEVKRKKLPAVTHIAIQIGALSDIVPDALSFNFEAITRDTPFESTQLIIEQVALKGACKCCNSIFKIENLVFKCPDCSSGQIEVIQGEELDISYIKVADPESCEP